MLCTSGLQMMAKFRYELLIIIASLILGAQAQVADLNLALGLTIGTLTTAAGCAPILIICLCACIVSLVFRSISKSKRSSASAGSTFIINPTQPTLHAPQPLQPSQVQPTFQAPWSQSAQTPPNFQAPHVQLSQGLQPPHIQTSNSAFQAPQPNQLQPFQSQPPLSSASTNPNNVALIQGQPPSYTPTAVHQAPVAILQNNHQSQQQTHSAARPLPGLPSSSTTRDHVPQVHLAPADTPRSMATNQHLNRPQPTHTEVTSTSGRSSLLPPPSEPLSDLSLTSNPAYVSQRLTVPTRDAVPQVHLAHETSTNTPSSMATTAAPNISQLSHTEATIATSHSSPPRSPLTSLPLTSNPAYSSRAPPSTERDPDEDPEGYVISDLENRSSRRLKKNADLYTTVDNDYMKVIN